MQQHRDLLNNRYWHIVSELTILPAVTLGIFGMILTGISPVLWGQQAAAFLLCLLCVGSIRRAVKKVSSLILVTGLVIVLASSLLAADVGGAKRWIDLGIFNVNAAFLLLPMLLVLLSNMHFAAFFLLCTASVLCVQPDVSQLMAFAAASFPILWSSGKARGWSLLCAALQVVLLVICSYTPTAIEPLPHCEGVLMMLGELSPLLLLAGALSLALIPLIWGYYFLKVRSRWILCLTIYYTVTILFGLTGEYPMPFMGFGLSPIVGYLLAAQFAPDTENRIEE